MMNMIKLSLILLAFFPTVSFALSDDEVTTCINNDVSIKVAGQQLASDAQSFLSGDYVTNISQRLQNLSTASADCAAFKSKMIELKNNVAKLHADADALLSN